MKVNKLIVLDISSCFFILLFVPDNVRGYSLAAVMTALSLLTGVLIAKGYHGLTDIKTKLCASISLIVGGMYFYIQHLGDGKIQKVADRLDIDRTFFLIALTCLLCILSFPFALKLFSFRYSTISMKNENILHVSLKIILFAATMASLVMKAIECTVPSIWNDEAFSLSLVEHSFHDVVLLTSRDVHPPLYYIILKFFMKLLHTEHSIVIAAFTSFIPEIILVILSYTYIAKHFSDLTGEMFAFCMTSMPLISDYYSEIRMYSWALLFVTLAVLAAIEIANSNSRTAWTLLSLFSIAASYTHYFACIAVFSLYLILLFAPFVDHRKQISTTEKGEIQKKYYKRWILSALLSVVLYLPWLSVLEKQVTQVSDNYWISKLGVNDYIGFIIAIFGAFSMFPIFLYVFQSGPLNKERSISLFPILFVFAFGVITSAIMRPIMETRYLLPALGGLWLCFCIGVNNLKDASIKAVAVIITIIIGLYTEGTNTFHTIRDRNNAVALQKEFGQLQEEIPVIIESGHTGSSISYLTNNPCYVIIYEDKEKYIEDPRNKLTEDVYGNLSFVEYDDISRLLDEYQEIYCCTDVSDGESPKLEEIIRDTAASEKENLEIYHSDTDFQLTVLRKND
ncbi:MAG: glycosyltransferase family 39 protein [Firmicutes bacterium]|nr:glycosyltransferase family 39 protein [Bacillota bacterium]